MKKLSDDDLWPIAFRLAQQYPDSTDDLADAVIRAATTEKRAAFYRQQMARLRGEHPVETLRDAWAITRFGRSMTRRALLMLGMLAGRQRAGSTWSEIVETAPAELEMLAVLSPRRRSARGNQWRSRRDEA